MRLDIKPTDRKHLTIWRAHPSGEGDPGWRLSPAVNGIPIGFGERFQTWQAAINEAKERTR